MNSLSAIEKACREGVFVYTSNRQRIAGATASYHGVEAVKGSAWCHMWKTGIWDQVPLSAITITTESVQSKEESMATKVTDISGKRSGKRGGGGHTSLPSESAARAAGNGRAKKGDATSSLKDLGEIVGIEPGPEQVPTPEVEKKPRKKSGKSTVTVSRTSAKQGELPGVQTSKRKIPEIETLAEELETRKDEKKAADDRFKDAEENLIVSMKKHQRTHYSRTTWGTVEVKETKESAKFKREKSKPTE